MRQISASRAMPSTPRGRCWLHTTLVDSTRCGCCPSPGGTLVIKLQATYCKPLFKSSLQGQPYLNVTSCEPRQLDQSVRILLAAMPRSNSNGREVRENDIAVGIAERESSTMIAPPVAGVARSREGDRPRAEDAPAISIVIPTRHEAATIGALLYRTLASPQWSGDRDHRGRRLDRDNTVEVLKHLQEDLGKQLVILHRPRGSVSQRTLGTAVVTGIRAAAGQFVCVMDADGQHPPEVIPAMIDAARRTGADYVGGSRYLPCGSAEGLDGRKRKAISLGLALTARTVFLLTPVRDMTDPLTGFFLFRR